MDKEGGGSREVVTGSEAETREFGASLGRELGAGSVIVLTGTLGAGKTVLTKGIAESLGIETVIRSPSFTIVNEHRGGRLPLYHIDLYRLGGTGETVGVEDDLESLGIDEYLYGDGVTVIEWGESCRDLMPEGTIFVEITIVTDDKGGSSRRILVKE